MSNILSQIPLLCILLTLLLALALGYFLGKESCLKKAPTKQHH